MYQVCVRKDFEASHFLIGGDWGAENLPHVHQYSIEVLVEGAVLNEHGYLVDIDVLKQKLDESLSPYMGKMLNDCERFKNLNPSLEHFTSILASHIAIEPMPGLANLKIKLWEDNMAYAAYEMHLC